MYGEMGSDGMMGGGGNPRLIRGGRTDSVDAELGAEGPADAADLG